MVQAFGVVPTTSTSISTSTRADFLQQSLTKAVAAVWTVSSPLRTNAAVDTTKTLDNGIVVTVLKQGTGPKPDRGELVAIRFAAYNGDLQIDNIFDTPEPYYTRMGSGGLIPGVESTLPLMQLGDRWKLVIPVRVCVCLVCECVCVLVCLVQCVCDLCNVWYHDDNDEVVVASSCCHQFVPFLTHFHIVSCSLSSRTHTLSVCYSGRFGLWKKGTTQFGGETTHPRRCDHCL